MHLLLLLHPAGLTRSSLDLSQTRLSEDGVCLGVGSAKSEANAKPNRKSSSLEQEYRDNDTGAEAEAGLHNGVGQRCVPGRVHDGCRRLWLVGLFNGYCRHSVCMWVCRGVCGGGLYDKYGCVCARRQPSCVCSTCASFFLSPVLPLLTFSSRFDTQTEQTQQIHHRQVHGCKNASVGRSAAVAVAFPAARRANQRLRCRQGWGTR